MAGQEQLPLVTETREVARIASTPTLVRRAARLPIGPSSQGFLSFSNFQPAEESFALYERLGWIYAAVRRVALDISGLPRKVFSGKGKQEHPVESGPVVELLDNPNPLMTFSDIVEIQVSYLETLGAAYLLFDSRVPAIWPLRPDRVQPIISPSAELEGWEYRANEKVLRLPPEAVIPSTYLNLREPIGGRMSPLQPVSIPAQAMIASMLWNVRFFERGAAPSGFLTTDQALTDVEFERVIADVEENWQGSQNAHGVPVMDKGITFEQLEANHKDMGFEGLLRLSREEVLGAMGVPPAIVGDFKQANYAQVEMQYKGYWRLKVMPIARRLEETYSRFMLRQFAPQERLRFAFVFSGVEALQEDRNAKAAREEIMVRTGLRNRAELREADGLKPYEGADEFLLAQGLVPARTKAEMDAREKERAEAARPPGGGAPPAPAGNKSAGEELETRASDERRAAIVRRFDAKLRRAEVRMADYWQEVLFRLEREVITRVRQRPPTQTSRAADDEKPPLGPIPLPNPIETYLPESAEYIAAVQAGHAAIFRRLIAEFGGEALDEIGSEFAFDVGTPRVIETIIHDEEQIGRSTARLLDDVKEELEAGLNQGESIADMAKRIRQAVAESAETPARGGPYVRSERIARTEAHSAAGFARMEGYAQTGVEEHQWSSSHDGFVRESHAGMDEDGETVRVGEPFSNGCTYPGDPAGGPSESINCRCLTLPVAQAMRVAA